jgi:hypothetical protein
LDYLFFIAEAYLIPFKGDAAAVMLKFRSHKINSLLSPFSLQVFVMLQDKKFIMPVMHVISEKFQDFYRMYFIAICDI